MSRRIGSTVLAVLLGCSGLLVAAPAQAASGTVSGYVRTGSFAAPHAEVSLEPTSLTGGPAAGPIYSANDGYYTLSAAPGTYYLYATYTLAGTTSSWVGLVTLTSGGTLAQDVPLLAEYACSARVLGRPYVGQTLTADVVVSTAEHWQRYGIVGWFYANRQPDGTWGGGGELPETSPVHVATDADLGTRLEIWEFIWNPSNGRFGNCSARDDQKVVIGRRLPALSGPPVVSGKDRVGKRLSASVAQEAGTVASYRWFRVVRKRHHVVTKAIAGATGSSYKLRRKDAGAKVYVEVTGSGGVYATSVQDSAPAKVHR